MRHIFAESFLIIMLVLVVACTGCSRLPYIPPLPSTNPRIIDTPTPHPTIPLIINHAKPHLGLDNTVFEQKGCERELFDGLFECSPSSPLANVGCDVLKNASDLLGGLAPKYPIALCLRRSFALTDTLQTHFRDLSKNEYFYNYFDDVMHLPLYTRYVIFRNNQFELVQSPAEFKQIFAPIDSPEEALAYALALNNWTTYYNLSVQPKYQYFVPFLADTHIEQVSHGYVVNLYHYQIGGCGPHWTTLYNIKVSVDGSVELQDQINAFKDPAEDGLCVD